MFKRLFWISIGVGIGAVAVTKAQAYVKTRPGSSCSDQTKIMWPYVPLKACSMSSTKHAEPAKLNLIPNMRAKSADSSA